MALHRSLIAIIARRNPSIWEEIIGPHGPLSRFDAVALNPQPLPPKTRVALNPQPLPPGVEYGASSAPSWCGPPGSRSCCACRSTSTSTTSARRRGGGRRSRGRPPPWPPRPEPWRHADDFDGDFDFGYAVGLAFVLESSVHGWEHLEAPGALERVHEAAFTTAERRAADFARPDAGRARRSAGIRVIRDGA